MNRYQTRIAPTPSGFLHLGNVFAFLVTAMAARQYDLVLRLRIDDLDRRRFRQAYLEDVFSVLRVLGIDWQLGPKNAVDFLSQHRQALRFSLYEHFLERLRATGLVYACGCTRAEMEAQGHNSTVCIAQKRSLDDPSCAWRLQLEPGKVLRMQDFKEQTQLITLVDALVDPVVRRKQERSDEAVWPAYHLACVADDVFYGTTHIVRGADLYESSLVQLYLAEVLNEKAFSNIRFLHHAVVQGANGQKLSKSAGDGKGNSLLATYTNGTQLFTALGQILGAEIADYRGFEAWWYGQA